MTDTPQWVCLSINQNAIREGDLLRLIEVEMRKVFGSDICDMVVMCDKLSKEIFEMNVENYLFVKVKNYFEHVKALKESALIFGVLDSYDRPAYIEETEVYKFRDSIKFKFNADGLKVGDLVQVKEGFLKNLKGVVLEVTKNGERYKVMFKFHTHSIVENMWRKNLVYVANIFEIEPIKSRYQTHLKASHTDENKLCRKKSKQHKYKGQRRGRVGK